MQGWVTSLDHASTIWASALWRGCWQGTLLLATVAVACKLFPRIPAAARYWLWWLACAKFIVGAALTVAIPLAILPSNSATLPAARPVALVKAALIGRPVPTSPAPHEIVSTSTKAVDFASAISVPHPSPKPAHRLPSIASMLFVVWCIGVILLAMSTVGRTLRLARIVRCCSPAGSTVEQIIRDQSTGLVRAIVSDNIEGLCVTGLMRPVLLIPSTWESMLSVDEQRMAIAHELAHLRRRDLLFDVAPAVASTLFFFLPVVRYAARMCGQAREEACDVAAMKAVSCTFEGYAALLLKSAADRPTMAGALGVSPAYQQLKGRLTGLATASQSISATVKVVVAVVVGVGLIVSAPWRLVARAARNVAKDIADATRYDIVDLGPISGDDASHFQINDAGQVVGTSNGHPYLWQNGKSQTLGTLWYHNGRGGGINNRGVYAVTCYSDAGNPHAFVASNRAHLVKGLRGYRFTVARGVNDSGWIVGSALHSGSDAEGAEIARAVLVTGGRTRDLGTLGGDHSAAYAVNGSGQIVGKADLPVVDGVRPTHAFVWQSGVMHDLGTLGGTHSNAYAVNGQGVVAGFSLVDGDWARHACVWQTAGGRGVDLGGLPGDTTSEAHGVNDRNQVVGTSDSQPDAADNRAVLWENGGAVDLNVVADTRGQWRLADAMSINNSGVVVGKGTLNGVPHAFMLTPRRTH